MLLLSLTIASHSMYGMDNEQPTQPVTETAAITTESHVEHKDTSHPIIHHRGRSHSRERHHTDNVTQPTSVPTPPSSTATTVDQPIKGQLKEEIKEIKEGIEQVESEAKKALKEVIKDITHSTAITQPVITKPTVSVVPEEHHHHHHRDQSQSREAHHTEEVTEPTLTATHTQPENLAFRERIEQFEARVKPVIDKAKEEAVKAKEVAEEVIKKVEESAETTIQTVLPQPVRQEIVAEVEVIAKKVETGVVAVAKEVKEEIKEVIKEVEQHITTIASEGTAQQSSRIAKALSIAGKAAKFVMAKLIATGKFVVSGLWKAPVMGYIYTEGADAKVDNLAQALIAHGRTVKDARRYVTLRTAGVAVLAAGFVRHTFRSDAASVVSGILTGLASYRFFGKRAQLADIDALRRSTIAKARDNKITATEATEAYNQTITSRGRLQILQERFFGARSAMSDIRNEIAENYKADHRRADIVAQLPH